MTDADLRAHAQALAARRRRASFMCEVCTAPFDGLDRPKQQPRFCSVRCRVAHHRALKRAAATRRSVRT